MAEIGIYIDRARALTNTRTRLGQTLRRIVNKKSRKVKGILQESTLPAIPSALGAAAATGLTLLDAAQANQVAADAALAQQAKIQAEQQAAADREETARIIQQKQERPALLPVIEVEKSTWLEILTTNPKEQDKAKRLTDEQMPRVKGIAIDPETQGPSKKLQQLIKYKDKIAQEEIANGLPQGHLFSELVVEGWLDDSLSADAAREVGLRVDDDVDEREIPTRYIEGMAKYLAREKKMWGGRLDFAMFAFNSGRFNLAEYTYLISAYNGDNLSYPTVSNFTMENNPYAQYLIDHKISLYQLITHPALKDEIDEIHEIYTPRIAAALKYLQDKEYVPKEHTWITVPFAQQEPKPRTDGAVV